MEEGCAFAPVEWGLGGKNGHVVKNLEYDVGDIHVAVVARGYGYGCGCCGDYGGYVEWTYQLVDGVCTHSMAFVTAARFGVPDTIVARAKELASYANPRCSLVNNGIEGAVPSVVW